MLVFSLVNYILPNVVWKKIYLWFFYGINELKSFFTTDICVVYNIEKGVTCLILPFKTKRSGVCVVCNKFQV